MGLGRLVESEKEVAMRGLRARFATDRDHARRESLEANMAYFCLESALFMGIRVGGKVDGLRCRFADSSSCPRKLFCYYFYAP